MSTARKALLTAALALAAPAWAQDPEAGPADVSVSAHVEPSEVKVGERFTVELRAHGPEGTEWAFPARAGDDTVELWSAPSPPGASPEPLPPGVFRYRAAAYALKDVAVPPVTVSFRRPDGESGEVATRPVALNIRSVLPKDPEQQQLADVRKPLELVLGWPFWAALGLLALLLAGFGLWLWRRKRPRGAVVPSEPDLPADERARRDLEALAARGLVASGAYRPFYIALSEIAKRYLEQRLGAPVLEMTSTEMTAYLRQHADGSAIVGLARELAGAADQVKFARGEGRAQEADRHLAAVREMIDAVEKRLTPAEAESPR